MPDVSLFLFRKSPELWIGENHNRLENLSGKPLELFVVMVIHLILDKPLDSESLGKTLYRASPDSNVINKHMEKIFDAIPELGRSRENLESLVLQPSLDVLRFEKRLQTLTPQISVDDVAALLEDGIALYGRGFLPNWDQSWLASLQAYYRKRYLNLWKYCAAVLIQNKRQGDLITMIDKALDQHRDPDTEVHKYLDALRDELNAVPEKPAETKTSESTTAQKEESKQEGNKTFNQTNIADIINQTYNL